MPRWLVVVLVTVACVWLAVSAFSFVILKLF
jgi:hypothetical protein